MHPYLLHRGIFTQNIPFSSLTECGRILFTYLNMSLVRGSFGDIGLTLHCIVWCYIFWWISWLGVQLVALTADDSDCVGVCKWMRPWLCWNGLKKADCVSSALFVGWKRTLPIFMWDAFAAEWLPNPVNDRFKNIFPVSAFFLHFCFNYSLLWVRRFSVELIAQSFLCAVNLCGSVSMNNRLKG